MPTQYEEELLRRIQEKSSDTNFSKYPADELIFAFALHYACYYGNIDAVEEIIKILGPEAAHAATMYTPSPTSCWENGFDGWTPLQLAIMHCPAKSVQAILDIASDPAAAAHMAASTPRYSIYEGWSSLHLAIHRSTVETVQAIIKTLGENAAGVAMQPVSFGKYTFRTPLYFAVKNNDGSARPKVKAIISVLGIDTEGQLTNEYCPLDKTEKNLVCSCILEFIKEELFPQLLKGETLPEKHRALFDKDEYRQALKKALFEHCDHNGKPAKSNLEILKSALDPQTKLGAIFAPCSAQAAFFGLVTTTPAGEVREKIDQLQAFITKGDQKAADMQRDEWLSLNNGVY